MSQRSPESDHNAGKLLHAPPRYQKQWDKMLEEIKNKTEEEAKKATPTPPPEPPVLQSAPSKGAINQRQRIVIALGTALALLAGLFPGFQGEYAAEGRENPRCRMGHYFLLLPPTQEDVCRAFIGRDPSTIASIALKRYNARVLFAETALQLLVIVIGTTGGVLLLKK